jgi:uncharacterized protein
MSGLRIDIADLLSRPGARREVSVTEALDDLQGTAARVDVPVHVDITLERIPEGIVVRGSVRAEWHAECSACLRDLERNLDVHVDELFEPRAVEGETYPIEGDEIDLEQLVRDAVLLELPLAPHCDEPCTPDPIGDADNEPDPRWAALADLELAPPAQSS